MSGMHEDQERLTEALSAYLDGALDGAERDALERHLATCEDCRAELAGLRRVGALLRALPEPALPRSFTLPATATRDGRAAPRRAPGWARAAQWVGGLAAALGVGLLVAGAIQSPQYEVMTSAGTYSQGIFSRGGASSAPSAGGPSHTPNFDQSTAAASPPTSTGTFASGTEQGSPLQTGTPSVPSTPGVTPSVGNQSTRSPLIPAGATLLVGGGAALAAGTVSRRRARRSSARSR